MAPPPVDRSGGGESTAGDSSRTLPTPFLTKTYQIVDDQAVDDIVSWSEDGSSFIVWNPTDFAKDLLPKYFKHNNFSSFVRQLNTYGFRKLVPDRWEFSNECFRRGEKKLLRDIQRRKIANAAAQAAGAAAVQPVPATAPPPTVSPSDSGEEQVISSSHSPCTVREFNGTTAELLGENERLKRENSQLNKELSQMKSLCNNIYSLMSNYAGNSKNSSSSNDQQGESCKSDSSENAVRPLDLLPMTRFCEEMKLAASAAAAAAAAAGEESSLRSAAEEINAKLFGVPIRTKRGREGSAGSAEHDMDLQLQQPSGEAQYEPMDQDGKKTNDCDRDSSGLKTSTRNRRACS